MQSLEIEKQILLNTFILSVLADARDRETLISFCEMTTERHGLLVRASVRSKRNSLSLPKVTYKETAQSLLSSPLLSTSNAVISH